MNIGIYQTVNAHAPAIHWWLAHDNRFGPQLYCGQNPSLNGDDIGSIVQEIRRNADGKGFNHIMDNELYNIHQESLREMENKDEENGRIDCTSAYFDINKGLWGNGEDPIVGYEYPVWSNYFGCTKETIYVPACDKLIFAKSTIEQSAMFYITQYAFSKIELKDITTHSRIWWEDHMLMGGNNISTWKEVWYRDYHDQCLADCMNGKLQYMWQLNFAHWDLFDSLKNGGDGKFDLDYSFYRLFEEKHKSDDIEAQDVSIRSMAETNVDHLLIDAEWFNKTDIILDYLGVKSSNVLIETAALYRERYNIVITAYDKLYNKYYSS